MIPMDQLRLGFRVFDYHLKFFEEILGDLKNFRFRLNDWLN